MEEQSLNLNELYLYLRDKDLADDVKKYIITSFKKLAYYYKEYESFDPWILDRNELIIKYIDNLMSVSKINFIRDINENTDFVKRIISLNGTKIPIGYSMDISGKYIVVKDNPSYYCPLIGNTDHNTREINILFDEFAKNQYEFLLSAFPHELIHVNQVGFYLPWYVINKFYLTKCLKEGNAMRESRYASSRITAFCKIPFIYNEEQQKYETLSYNNYDIYKYIYSKLEILLGNDFMNKWAHAKNDFTYLSRARETINLKYGNNVFEKIYEAIQIIIFNIGGFSIKDMEDINNELIITSFVYDDIKTSKETTFKIKDKSLNEDNPYYTEEMVVRQDPKNFKIIISANIRACQEVIENPNSLVSAITKLELTILKCLLKDLDKNSEFEYKKCQYYISNLGTESFKYSGMNEVKEEFVRLKVKKFLKSTIDFSLAEYKEDETCLIKKEHHY